ncbi:predicted protein [Botrytis cinerea T4]|uniref:Uncharacterized protein n=1 Tax=Botryotinia fuckeliana (strain T4) TaxID=999810 RepID=G2Y3A7_BOTF4|nr:predicted protein [Botrytis cinerea T4]
MIVHVPPPHAVRATVNSIDDVLLLSGCPRVPSTIGT